MVGSYNLQLKYFENHIKRTGKFRDFGAVIATGLAQYPKLNSISYKTTFFDSLGNERDLFIFMTYFIEQKVISLSVPVYDDIFLDDVEKGPGFVSILSEYLILSYHKANEKLFEIGDIIKEVDFIRVYVKEEVNKRIGAFKLLLSLTFKQTPRFLDIKKVSEHIVRFYTDEIFSPPSFGEKIPDKWQILLPRR